MTNETTLPPSIALTDLNELAKLYCSSYASPNHITFTVEGLRHFLAAALTQAGAAPHSNGELSAERIAEIVREHLTAVYHCTRAWSAWDVGTMSQADFDPADESELADEIAASILPARKEPLGSNTLHPVMQEALAPFLWPF